MFAVVIVGDCFQCLSYFIVGAVQEFLAYGFMNLFGSFFGSFATAGALSRTVLQHTLGGNTQVGINACTYVHRYIHTNTVRILYVL